MYVNKDLWSQDFFLISVLNWYNVMIEFRLYTFHYSGVGVVFQAVWIEGPQYPQHGGRGHSSDSLRPL